MLVFVVYDSAAEAYGLPFYQRTIGEALRGFSQAVKDPNSQLSRSPADFTLFEIGHFDEFSGTIEMYDAKKSLGTALEHVGAR